MKASGPVIAELKWAGFVAAQWAVLALVGLAAALLWEDEELRESLQDWEPRVRGLVWFTLLLAIPLFAVIASVLLRAWMRGTGFASRGARLGFHAVACYVATLLFLGVLAAAEQTGLRVSVLPFVGVLAPASVLLLFVYWPRLVFPTLTGLADEPARHPPARDAV